MLLLLIVCSLMINFFHHFLIIVEKQYVSVIRMAAIYYLSNNLNLCVIFKCIFSPTMSNISRFQVGHKRISNK